MSVAIRADSARNPNLVIECRETDSLERQQINDATYRLSPLVEFQTSSEYMVIEAIRSLNHEHKSASVTQFLTSHPDGSSKWTPGDCFDHIVDVAAGAMISALSADGYSLQVLCLGHSGDNGPIYALKRSRTKHELAISGTEAVLLALDAIKGGTIHGSSRFIVAVPQDHSIFKNVPPAYANPTLSSTAKLRDQVLEVQHRSIHLEPVITRGTATCQSQSRASSRASHARPVSRAGSFASTSSDAHSQRAPTQVLPYPSAGAHHAASVKVSASRYANPHQTRSKSNPPSSWNGNDVTPRKQIYSVPIVDTGTAKLSKRQKAGTEHGSV